jgi:hypothetical protein
MVVKNMGNIDWDDSPNAGDCYTTATWNNMITYIKHSTSCDFTIYDDELSTSQKFKFTYAGNDNTIAGDDTTAKNLIIKATSADAYPYMELFGNAGITEYLKAGSDFKIFDATNEIMKIDRQAGETYIYGPATASGTLWIVDNSVDALWSKCLIQMSDGVFIFNHKNGGRFRLWSHGSNEYFDIHYTSAIPTIETIIADNDIYLKTNGLGRARFGTVVGTGDVACNGYLEIKDSAGNTVKLMKCA